MKVLKLLNTHHLLCLYPFAIYYFIFRAPFIANSILRDERLLIPLYIFAPAIIFPSLALY